MVGVGGLVISYYIALMKANTNKYTNVNQLPSNALTVREYAEQYGISTAYIYKQIKQGRNRHFDIVVFQTINFIIPNN